MKPLISLFTALFLTSLSYSHPGDVDASGGHYDRVLGDYHFHESTNNSTKKDNPYTNAAVYGGGGSLAAEIRRLDAEAEDAIYARKVEMEYIRLEMMRLELEKKRIEVRGSQGTRNSATPKKVSSATPKKVSFGEVKVIGKYSGGSLCWIRWVKGVEPNGATSYNPTPNYKVLIENLQNAPVGTKKKVSLSGGEARKLQVRNGGVELVYVFRAHKK